MSKKQTKTKNRTVRSVTYILILLLIVGLLGGVMYMLRKSVGMYVEYNGETITSDNSGIIVTYSDTEATTFTICNTDDWGVYDVTGCTVKVINNVSSSSDKNFEYTANGSLSLYSNITDFTSLFSVDGGNVTVSSDGTFELMFRYEFMSDILEAYTGYTVTFDGDHDLCDYPYFAIQVISPDGSETITIPFVLSGWLKLNYTELYFY